MNAFVYTFIKIVDNLKYVILDKYLKYKKKIVKADFQKKAQILKTSEDLNQNLAVVSLDDKYKVYL